MRRVLPIAAVLAIAVAAAFWWYSNRGGAPTELTLYGNVDLRQVDLAFNGSERIAAVDAQEGDRVHKGEILARLDTGRLEPQLAQAEAQAAAQRAVVERMHHGSRPEEIEQARANLEQAKADAANALAQYQRKTDLLARNAGTQMDFDNAKAALDMAQARARLNQSALDLTLAGPRKEDIAQAEAQLRGNQAQFAYLQALFADAQLKAPVDAVVRSRLMEPGDMASPQRPVFSLALTDPKWVRAYVVETDLGKLHPGTKATVTVDSFPERGFEGWIGFISPVAEFTPKDVQTPELRTSLVYEVRAFVNDPSDELRLGMPATVHLALTPPAASPARENRPTAPGAAVSRR
jgi:HlyD family secretion protein